MVRRLLVSEKYVPNVHFETPTRFDEWIKRQAKVYFVKAYAVFLGFIPIPNSNSNPTVLPTQSELLAAKLIAPATDKQMLFLITHPFPFSFFSTLHLSPIMKTSSMYHNVEILINI